MPFAKKQLKRIKPVGFAHSEFRPWRSIKMVEPICSTCQEVAGGAPQDWYKTCEHNPYYTTEDVQVNEPIIEEVDGEKLITGHKTKLVRKETPNTRQVAYEVRINNSKGLENARANGLKLPEEEGYAPFCQFGDCWSQEIKVRHPVYGDYCNELQCKVIIADMNGTPLEVLDMDRRQAQLRGIAL